MQPLVLSIDQGTTSTRALLIDAAGETVASEALPHRQSFPADGWVEHDADEIFENVVKVSRSVLARADGRPVIAAAITNQRETTVVWDRASGKPIAPAIVWQDRRTAETCAALRQEGLEAAIQERTGLLLDPYFSATKLAWLLDHVPGARARAERGELAFGTIDTWLIWRLTGGKTHASDATNASRTLLYDIRRGAWDEAMLRRLGIPAGLLPEVRDSAGSFGTTSPDVLGASLPILGVAGDQQAAAIGQACFKPGMVKSTYGTGCFMLMNTGTRQPMSKTRLLGTIAYRLAGEVTYALEGSIFMAGAIVDWLKSAGFISHPKEAMEIAKTARADSQVVLVPAFVGLGAPYWAAEARGAFIGMTRDTGRAELVGAAMDSIAFQTRDLLEAMRADTGQAIAELRVDGGLAVSDPFLRRLADLTGVTVTKASTVETTALGAAMLAFLASGILDGPGAIARTWREEARFEPRLDRPMRDAHYARWQAAVRRSL